MTIDLLKNCSSIPVNNGNTAYNMLLSKRTPQAANYLG